MRSNTSGERARAPLGFGLGLVLVLAALLACKSQSKLDGTVTLNGAPFVVSDCGSYGV